MLHRVKILHFVKYLFVSADDITALVFLQWPLSADAYVSRAREICASRDGGAGIFCIVGFVCQNPEICVLNF